MDHGPVDVVEHPLPLSTVMPFLGKVPDRRFMPPKTRLMDEVPGASPANGGNQREPADCWSPFAGCPRLPTVRDHASAAGRRRRGRPGRTVMSLALTSTHPTTSSRRRWLALTALLVAEAVNLLDATIVQVAAPKIHAELGGPVSVVQWVTTAYTL